MNLSGPELKKMLNKYAKTHSYEQVDELRKLLEEDESDIDYTNSDIEKIEKLSESLELKVGEDEIRIYLNGDFVAYAKIEDNGNTLNIEEFATSNAKNYSPVYLPNAFTFTQFVVINAKNYSPVDLPSHLLKIISEELSNVKEKGLGTAALLKLIEYAKKNNYEFIELVSAQGADGFYEKAFASLEKMGLGERNFDGEYNVYRFMINPD